MAEADAATIDSGTPAAILMDRAGRAVAREALRMLGGRYGRRVVIVCGKGSNGGDGFVAARVLTHEGVDAVCTDAGAEFEPTGAAGDHLRALRRSGEDVRPFDAALLDEADLVVDAIFGTGFRGEVEGPIAKTIEAINDCAADVLSIDVPSGVDGATGAVDGVAVRATRTIAIAAEKIGTASAPGAAYAGAVSVIDIGIQVPNVDVHLIEASDVRAVLPMRTAAGHKRNNGSVAILAGSTGMTGAALLCTLGALRAGAGYATLGSTAHVIAAADVALPEAVKRPLSDGEDLGVDALERFGDVSERADSLALGPGLGDGAAQRELVARVLAEARSPVVLDADGLNVLAQDPTSLQERTVATVITPHPGELSRLTAASTGEIARDRLSAARRAAAELRCVVVLKGFRTVVADPSGDAVVIATGGPELATAGTGDILTGVVATLLAQGLGPFEAAWAGAHVHGLAGAVAGESAAGRGVVASDVAAALPAALALLAPAG